MGRRGKLSAHSLIRPAMSAVLQRIRTDADRVVREHDDEEAVHDFRVGLRRLRTILRASRGVYGKKKTKRLEAAAKSFGDATSALRDAEVLDETLRAAILGNQAQIASRAWLAEVKGREVALRASAVALIAGPDLEMMCGAAEKMLASEPAREEALAVYVEDRFDEVRFAVRELLPVEVSDIDRLHRLRIRFKRLRYTCEMVAQFMTVIDATGSEKKQRPKAHEAALRFSATARDASRMQKELGLLHDADQALVGLSEATIGADDRIAIENALKDLRDRLVKRSLVQLAKLPRRIVGDGPTVVTAETPLPVRA